MIFTADLQSTAKEMRSRLDKKEAAREDAIRDSRKIIRECRSAMASIQAGRDPSEPLNGAKKMHEHMKAVLADYPDLLSCGYTVDSEQELAEVEILSAVLADRDPPAPEEIGVTEEAYILGLGDAIGEMRRAFLHRLMGDDVEGAESLLGKMEAYFSILMTFDYPEALVAVKRKQDVARSLVEKCRGELVLSTHMSKLRKDLDEG